MFSTKDGFFRRARGFRRSRVDDSIPPVPPLPANLAPAAMPMLLSPTDSHFYPKHRRNLCSRSISRHVSTCSQVSHASSSWSTISSSASSISIASSTVSNPLRMNPTVLPSQNLDFGFTPKPRHVFRPVRIVLPSDDEEDDDLFDEFDMSNDEDFEYPTVLSPPPHQLRMRMPQSEANLHDLTRPVTPTTEASTSSVPSSPVRPRVHAVEGDVERFMKRGDWKRRGIVFGAQE